MNGALNLDLLILCGGRGRRLGALTATTPKPLLPVHGRPFVWRVLEHYAGEGFRRFFLAAHYGHEQFEAFGAQHRTRWPNLRVIVEPEPLGTGGAVRHAVAALRSSTVVVVNGDSWVSQPLHPVIAQHRARARVFTAVAVRASRVHGRARDKGVWDLDPRGAFRGFSTVAAADDGWVNAGMYVVERAAAARWPQGRYSLETSFPQLLAGYPAGVFRSSGSLLDIGTPDCYAWADQALQGSDRLMPDLTGAAHHESSH